MGAAAAAGLGLLAGCGGSSKRPPGDHAVVIAWQANAEKGVNAPGGGYRLVVAGKAPLDLPYPAPTSVTTVLYTGWYGVSVQAYQPDPEGAGTIWSAASSVTVVVP